MPEPPECNNPASILSKVNNRNTRAMCEICSKLTLTRFCLLWLDFAHCSGVSIVDFDQVNAGWESSYSNHSEIAYET